MELLVPIALILVGLALVAVEVTVVPGFNVVGVIGVLGAAVGVVVAFAEYGPVGGLGTLAATLLAAGGTAYVLYESGAWDRFVLSDSLRRDADADAVETESRARLLGQDRDGRHAAPPRRRGRPRRASGSRSRPRARSWRRAAASAWSRWTAAACWCGWTRGRAGRRAASAGRRAPPRRRGGPGWPRPAPWRR